MMAAFGAMITVLALAQQPAAPGQQMQQDSDKGIKTRNSGESGYVADQDKPGASAHPPGQPDSSSSQTTTGSSGGTSNARGSKAGGNSR
jgi:hypothetical protein